MRIGIMGGTFDPVHYGHLALAEAGRRQLALDRVVWVPAGDPWRKAERTVASAEHRVEMVRRAIGDNAAYQLCTIEVERAGPSYTVETLAELREQNVGDELVLLMGDDALEDLPNWKEPRLLLEFATVAVAPRGEPRPESQALGRLLADAGRRVIRIQMARVDISATEIRQRAAAGRSLRRLVPDAVAAYVREHHLYRDGE